MSNFPNRGALIEFAFQLFNLSAQNLIILVPLVAILRASLVVGFLKNKMELIDIARDVAFVFVAFYFFQGFMRGIIEIPYVAESWIGKTETFVLENAEAETSIFGWFSVKISDLLKILMVWVYWLTNYLYQILIALVICSGAFIIFFSSMFQMKFLMKLTIAFVLILSSFPFFWYGMDQLMLIMLKGVDSSGSKVGLAITSVGASICKVVAPIGGIILMLKIPTSAFDTVKGAMSEGIRPIKGIAKGVSNTAIKTANSTGISDVHRVHFKPKFDKAAQIGKAPVNALKQSAPLASYSVLKGMGSKAIKKKAQTGVMSELIGKKEETKSFKEYKNDLKQASSPTSAYKNKKSQAPPRNQVSSIPKSVSIAKARSLEGLKISNNSGTVTVEGNTEKHGKTLKNLGFTPAENNKKWIMASVEPRGHEQAKKSPKKEFSSAESQFKSNRKVANDTVI